MKQCIKNSDSEMDPDTPVLYPFFYPLKKNVREPWYQVDQILYLKDRNIKKNTDGSLVIIMTVVIESRPSLSFFVCVFRSKEGEKNWEVKKKVQNPVIYIPKRTLKNKSGPPIKVENTTEMQVQPSIISFCFVLFRKRRSNHQET